jgi:Uma2 family endonuclease
MQLANLNLEKLYTYADYFKWQFDERVELIKGKIFKMAPAPSPSHQDIAGEIYIAAKKALRGTSCKAYVAPFDVRFPGKSAEDQDIITVLQPDVCVICDPSKIDRRGCIGAPDIVVEVLSPGNNAKELKNKYEIYEEAGVREFWVVSPQDQTFLQHIWEDGRFKLLPVKVPGDVVTSTVLPGFTLDLTDLFRNIDPEKL